MQAEKEYRGLSSQEVIESREEYGSNLLTPAKKDPVWKLFLRKFQDPLIIILMVAGVCSIGISFYEYYLHPGDASVFFEPIGIFAAVFFATGLAFIFELKAEKEFAILNKVNDDEPVKVIRDGMISEIPKRDVVVGDILVLDTGEEIPADAQLLESSSLSVDESTLTGEPLAQKSTDPAMADPEATFPTDHVMRGTKVMEGHAVARAFAVGDATENGKVFTAAQIDNSVKTPLNEQLERLGGMISRITYCIAAVIIVGRVVLYFAGFEGAFVWTDFISYLLETVMVAVALLVVAVPEGLPMAVTLSLAYSMRRMLKTNNLVRKLHACETMGATTVICTDKTGTLTQNQMQVHEANFYGLKEGKLGEDADSQLIERGIAVNSTAELDFTNPDKPRALGNPTEGALMLWLLKQGLDYRKLRGEVRVEDVVPFSTERKYMATVCTMADGARILYVKGAPEIVIGLCSKIAGDYAKDKIDEQLAQYQSQAMRTLGFASLKLASDEVAIADGKMLRNDLCFQGIVAIADPVRGDVPAAVQECIDAGIAIKIVTGDTTGTAREIARQIGLWKPEDDERNMITGPEFAALSDEELEARINDFKIIARARPLDKKRLVETLQKKGHVVAVTGDGTNDAPALKAAQVGLSMGDGTSVAKEASDITIVDNSFASIGRAVMWGRSLYLNIQRFVMFQLTVNVVACLVVLVGAFTGEESPLTVTQMLWVNLVMDTFAAMGLASLPPSKRVMKEKPRSREAFIITGEMKRNIAITGLLFSVFLIGFSWVLEHFNLTSLTQLFGSAVSGGDGLSLFEMSIFFTTFVMLHFWNLFNARAYKTSRSAFHLAHCAEFLMVLAFIIVGQILIVSIGGQFFSVAPLAVIDWLLIIGISSVVLWSGEILRLFSHR